VQTGGQTLDVYSAMLVDGIIFVNTRIDQRVAGLVTSCMLQITARRDQAKSPKLYLNTNQGDMLAALTVVDIIEFYKKKNMQIQTVGFGEVGPAAGIILAAGTKGGRKIAAHSQVCLRMTPGNVAFGNLESDQAKATQTSKVMANVVDILAAYCRQDKNYFRLCVGSERYMGAEEAVEIGLADEII
jgi:ATP-dependent Clp protease, protease subunit